jgi:membrane-associated phospholipid phosphatase
MDMGAGMAPRRLDWAPILGWVLSGVVLVGLSVLLLDRPVATWSHDVLRRPALAVLVTKLADVRVFGLASIVVLLAALGMRMSGRRLVWAWRLAVAMAAATLLAILAVILLKFGAGRLWPETWIHNNPSWIGNGAYGFAPFHGGEGWGSFPSGHTARVTAPCAVLWRREPRLRLVWVALPVVMAAALVAANFHFVGDCLAGAYVGIAAAALALMLV